MAAARCWAACLACGICFTPKWSAQIQCEAKMRTKRDVRMKHLLRYRYGNEA